MNQLKELICKKKIRKTPKNKMITKVRNLIITLAIKQFNFFFKWGISTINRPSSLISLKISSSLIINRSIKFRILSKSNSSLNFLLKIELKFFLIIFLIELIFYIKFLRVWCCILLRNIRIRRIIFLTITWFRLNGLRP